MGVGKNRKKWEEAGNRHDVPMLPGRGIATWVTWGSDTHSHMAHLAETILKGMSLTK